MADPYFRELRYQPDWLLDEINSIDKEAQAWSDHFGFHAIELDPNLIQCDAALKLVHQVQPIARLGLLMIRPSNFYKWHRDGYRQCCLNMLISQNHNSHTLFGKDIDYQNMSVVELKYKPETLYLFNNQEQHCVVNLDGPRYLFSLYFCNETPYSTVRDKFVAANLIFA